MDKEPLIDNQPSTPDTCTKAVENPLVLQKILEKLNDSSDLLRCRLVSSTWRDLATELLLEKSDIRINFEYDDTSKSYRKVRATESETSKDPSPNPTLKELINLIETETKSQSHSQDQFRRNSNSTTNSTSTSQCRFPCGFFQFKGGELNSPEVQEFLALHGENIYGLYLDDFLVAPSSSSSSSLVSSSSSTTTTSTSESTCDLELFRKLLWKQVPHLTTLYLNFGQFLQFLPCSLVHTGKDGEKNSNFLTLPNLHTLGIYPMSWSPWEPDPNPMLDFLKEIIVESAVNLQAVYFVSSHPSSTSSSTLSTDNDNLPLGLLTWFQEMKKLHLVKSFGFLSSHFDSDYTEELEKISMYENLNLKEITIEDARSLLVYSRNSRTSRLSSHQAINSESIPNPISNLSLSERLHSRSLNMDLDSDVCQSLGRILWSSRSSIETLTIGNCFYEDLLPSVPFPQGGLINVKKLVLNHVNKKEKIPTNFHEISDDGNEIGIGSLTRTENIYAINIDNGFGFGIGPRPRKSPFYHQVPNVEEVIVDDKTLWHRHKNGNKNINQLPAQVFMSPQSLEDVRLFRTDPQKLEDSLELELYAVKERSLERKRRKRLHFIVVFTFSIISLILLSVYAMYMRSARKGKSSGGVNKPICKSICTHNEIDSFFQ